jgi:hypothetical protein
MCAPSHGRIIKSPLGSHSRVVLLTASFTIDRLSGCRFLMHVPGRFRFLHAFGRGDTFVHISWCCAFCCCCCAIRVCFSFCDYFELIPEKVKVEFGFFLPFFLISIPIRLCCSYHGLEQHFPDLLIIQIEFALPKDINYLGSYSLAAAASRCRNVFLF